MNSIEKSFNFLDGPPFINGRMHHGHALVSSIKDTILRHKENQGYKIKFNYGFDCHGLPLEQAIEKELGIDVKNADLKIVCNKAREIINRYVKIWEDNFKMLNRKIDDNKYLTSNLDFMDQLWENFYKLYEKGLIYKNYKVMPYSPKMGCSLSNFEANSNYMNVMDNSITIKFPVIYLSDESDKKVMENTYFLVWTTTPWSLVGNMGIGVNKDIEYVMIENDNNKYILSKDCVEKYFKEYNLIKYISGNDIINNYTYVNIFNHIEKYIDGEFKYSIYHGDFITTDAGTGLVHLAPMFGADDMDCIKPKHLPIFLDNNLNFIDDFEDIGLNGSYLLDSEVNVIKYLKSKNLLFKKEKYSHSYPMCWRTDTKLVYYANSSWFLNVNMIKDNLIENVKKINWHPNDVGENRFNRWVENSIDWCLSRNRIWGTPLPIFVNLMDENDFIIVKNKLDLENYLGYKVDDLHLDNLINVRIKLNNKEYKIMGDVFDCWFESGMTSIILKSFINDGKDEYQPFDFITESIDQTRGWFYTLNVLSTALYNKQAFKDVKVSGLILASDGKKMSKRLNNYTDPLELIKKYNSDILRLYLISSPASKGESFNFNDNDLGMIYKKMIPFYSAINMFNDYIVDIENCKDIEFNVTGLDEYIISKINDFKEKINKKLDNYDTSGLDNDILGMIDIICNLYIRLSRSRINGMSGKEKYYNTYMVFDYIINEFLDSAKSILPYTYENIKNKKNTINNPFYENYKNIVGNNDFDTIYQVIESTRRLRSKNNMRLTLPITKTIIYIKKDLIGIVKENLEYINTELNSIDIDVVDVDTIPLKFKPNFRMIGKVYKKESKKISKIIESCNSIEELKDNNIDERFYTKEIDLEESKTIKYLSENNYVICFDISINDLNNDMEMMMMLRKHINNSKKEKGITWFDDVMVYLDNDEKLIKYSEYLRKLNVVHKLIDGLKDGEFKYNNFKYNIKKFN